MQQKEDVFRKEFKEMMIGRRNIARAKGFSICSVPVPKEIVDCELGYRKGTIMTVNGVGTEYFNRLNNEHVSIIEGDVTKKVIGMDGEVVRDTGGKICRERVKVPRGSLAVISKRNIGVPVSGYTEKNFFVDYVDTKHGKYYIYVLDKKYLKASKLYALVLSENKKTNYHKCYKIAFQSGEYGYLSIVPFSGMRNLFKSRVIVIKGDKCFEKEITTLLEYWQDKMVIFNLRYLAMSDSENLGLSISKGA